MIQTGHETGGRMVNANCDAHLMIDDVSVQTEYGLSLKCTMSVLAATDPAQVGRTLTEFFKADGNAAGMFLNLAEATGLITREARESARATGIGMSIDEAQLKGRQLCARIAMKPNLRKNPATGLNEVDPDKPGPYPRIGFETYALWDPKMSHVPKDPQFAGMVPRPPNTPPPASPPAPQPAKLPPAPPQQPAGQQALPLTGPAKSAISMDW